MDKTIPQLHLYQKEILQKLLLSDGVKFSELNIEGLESEHMNYHLKKLVDRGFVQKNDDQYQLTNKGKDYSNMLDDDIKYIEKQPKTSIIVRAVRQNSNGEVEHLMNRRLRHPYKGKVGRISGKAKFDETLWEAASREFYEETGLTAKEFYLEKVYHKIRFSEEEDILQNVIFYIFFAKNISGKLIEKTKWQENFWVTEEEARGSDEYDLYDDLNFIDDLEARRLTFEENKTLAEGF